MFCFKCGTKVTDGAVFCPKCGEKLIQDNGGELSESAEITVHAAEQIVKTAQNVNIPENQRVSGSRDLSRYKFKNMNVVGKAGFICMIIGMIGSFIGHILMPSSGSGSYVSAERHMDMVAQMDRALPFSFGGKFLVIIGLLIIILSSRKKKR